MCKSKPFDLEEVIKWFRYENGRLIRLSRKPGFEGQWIEVDISKPSSKHGYVEVRYEHRMIKAHRLIYALVYGPHYDQSLNIDHINGNRLDNHPENLRLVTPRGNSCNKESHRNGRLPGCAYHKASGKWQAYVTDNNEYKYLGLYATQEEAHSAYLAYLEANGLK